MGPLIKCVPCPVQQSAAEKENRIIQQFGRHRQILLVEPHDDVADPSTGSSAQGTATKSGSRARPVSDRTTRPFPPARPASFRHGSESGCQNSRQRQDDTIEVQVLQKPEMRHPAHFGPILFRNAGKHVAARDKQAVGHPAQRPDVDAGGQNHGNAPIIGHKMRWVRWARNDRGRRRGQQAGGEKSGQQKEQAA